MQSSKSLSLKSLSITETLAQVQDSIRSDPTNSLHRVHLFQLQVVLGLWDKALIQLQAGTRFDGKISPMASAYREIIRCEVYRAEVFAGKRLPNFLGSQYKWMLGMLRAIAADALDERSDARDARTYALESAPSQTALINGDRVEWLADADSRLGPICEVLVNGQYCWVPFCDIQTLTIEKPVDLRDLVWVPMGIKLKNGEAYSGFIPTRYPGTELTDNDALRLSRLTTWTDKGDEVWFGLGQRVLVSDIGEYSLLDIREIKF